MADEARLRKALRESWDAKKFGELCWVEHARGGTEGNADVFVPLGEQHGYCPVELKWWEVGGGNLNGIILMTARPAQKRFHILARRVRMRTAYLALLSSGDYVMLPGWLLQDEYLSGRMAAMVYARFIPGIEVVRETLLDEGFWKGKKK